VALPQPLESIWIAVNRTGILSGKVLGEAERYGNPAAKADIDALRSHIDGCRLEFWRAMAAHRVDALSSVAR
jgi:hypothetical protein